MHSHGHCCEHEEVNYCKVCKIVYCVKCGKEWKEYQYTITYPNGTPFPYWVYTTGGQYKIQDASTTAMTCNHHS